MKKRTTKALSQQPPLADMLQLPSVIKQLPVRRFPIITALMGLDHELIEIDLAVPQELGKLKVSSSHPFWG